MRMPRSSEIVVLLSAWSASRAARSPLLHPGGRPRAGPPRPARALRLPVGQAEQAELAQPLEHQPLEAAAARTPPVVVAARQPHADEAWSRAA